MKLISKNRHLRNPRTTPTQTLSHAGTSRLAVDSFMLDGSAMGQQGGGLVVGVPWIVRDHAFLVLAHQRHLGVIDS